MKSWLFAALFAGIGVPLILADAASTSRALDAHDRRADASRETRCVGLAGQYGLSRERGQALCGCVVGEARRRGIEGPHGAYDEARLPAVLDHCERATGIAIAGPAPG